MSKRGLTSIENAAVEVYVGMYGYVTMTTHGNGTWGGIEINTTFQNRADIEALIAALQNALKMTEAYDGK